MVNTKEMLPDEYSHYVLRYSAIRSGLSSYNLDTPMGQYDDFVGALLRSMYEAMFDNLMDDLEGMDEDQRVKALDYFVEQIDREEFTRSLGVYGDRTSPNKSLKTAKKSPRQTEIDWD